MDRSELADILLQSSPPYQRVILEDGHVSRAEYEEAFHATRACVEEAGFEVTPPKLNEHGALYFHYRSVEDGEGVDVANMRYEDCYGEHMDRVDMLYFFDPEPTD